MVPNPIMFIRTKKVKLARYAYLVRNQWTKKGARQKVSKYLGRVYAPERVADNPYYNYIDNNEEFINRSNATDIMRSLITWVLADHGFESKKHIWSRENVSINLRSLKVRENGKPVVVNLNSDYLCDLTLRRLIRFKSAKDQQQVGMELAKAIISAGIPVPQEIFVHIFRKVYKKGQSYTE